MKKTQKDFEGYGLSRTWCYWLFRTRNEHLSSASQWHSIAKTKRSCWFSRKSNPVAPVKAVKSRAERVEGHVAGAAPSTVHQKETMALFAKVRRLVKEVEVNVDKFREDFTWTMGKVNAVLEDCTNIKSSLVHLVQDKSDEFKFDLENSKSQFESNLNVVRRRTFQNGTLDRESVEDKHLRAACVVLSTGIKYIKDKEDRAVVTRFNNFLANRCADGGAVYRHDGNKLTLSDRVVTIMALQIPEAIGIQDRSIRRHDYGNIGYGHTLFHLDYFKMPEILQRLTTAYQNSLYSNRF